MRQRDPDSTTPHLSRRNFLRVTAGLAGALLAGCRPSSPEDIVPLPDYVDGGCGVPVFRGPYLQRDAHLAAFLLSADVDILQQGCETALNTSEDIALNYVPFGPYVLLVYAEMLVQSLDKRDHELGWMKETEVGLWVPLVARKNVGGVNVIDHVAWWLPYVFVDNPYAITTGREVYGFNKTWGSFEHPDDIRVPEFALDVWGFDAFGPEAEGKPRRLLEVCALDSGEDDNPGEWTQWDAARSALIRHLFADWNPGEREDDAAWLETLETTPLVFRKQFRDAADFSKACYQVILEVPLRMEAFHGGGMLTGSYGLTLHPLASHPLAGSLGVYVDTEGIARALAAFWLHVDFVLESGMIVE